MTEEEIQKLIQKAIDTVTKGVEGLDKARDAAEAAKTDAQKAIAKDTERAFQEAIRKATAALRNLIGELVRDGKASVVTKKLRDALAQIGIHVGKTSGATAKVVKGVFGGLISMAGKILGAAFDIMANPTPISGPDTRVLHEIVLNIDGKCFRLSWIQQKGSDEIAWGPVRLRYEEVDCPEEPEP